VEWLLTGPDRRRSQNFFLILKTRIYRFFTPPISGRVKQGSFNKNLVKLLIVHAKYNVFFGGGSDL
jgi:hypothetical protein